MVKKKDGSVGMCINYWALNKKTIKYKYHIPMIGELMDELKRAKYFSKIYLSSGYHQIKMTVEDQEKTAFITPFGAFCYVSMPFGLKCAQATYQRCVQNCLKGQI